MAEVAMRFITTSLLVLSHKIYLFCFGAGLALSVECLEIRRPVFKSWGLTMIFSPHHAQTGSVAHPTSHLSEPRGSVPGAKASGAWSWPPTFI